MDRTVGHSVRLAGTSSAPGPGAIGERARQLDIDPSGHFGNGTRSASENSNESRPDWRAGTVTAVRCAAMAVYALGDLEPTIHPDAFVHPDAVIIGSVTIGAHSSVWPGAVLRGDGGDIRIGERTSVQDNAVLHTTPQWPTVVGDGCAPFGRACRGDRGCQLGRPRRCRGSGGSAGGRFARGDQTRSGRPRVHPRRRAALRRPDRAVPHVAAPHRLMRALVVTVGEDDVDVASDVLWQLGVRAVEERPGASSSGVMGRQVELWTAVGDDGAATERAAAALGGRWDHRVVEVDAVHEGAERWREFASPMWVDEGLVIVPAWQESLPPTRPSPLVVSIEPGGAFGLGDHPTTLLSLRAVRRVFERSTSDRSAVVDVLDVGCGTGVIAVVGALLSERPVRAIDVASAAVEATLDNARRNGVGDRIEVDTTDLAAIDSEHDLVVANILAPALVSLADDLRRVTQQHGRLIVSGILAGSHQHVLRALAPMEVVHTDVLEGWACVELRHPLRP